VPTLFFISAHAAKEKEKKEKYCCPLVLQSLQPIQ
jgi:hypothetical protein